MQLDCKSLHNIFKRNWTLQFRLRKTLFSVLAEKSKVGRLGVGVDLFAFLARLLILIKKGGLLQIKFGVVGVNIYLWAR